MKEEHQKDTTHTSGFGHRFSNLDKKSYCDENQTYHRATHQRLSNRLHQSRRVIEEENDHPQLWIKAVSTALLRITLEILEIEQV